MATIINADTSDGLKLTSDTSGQIDFQSAGSTKATIDTSGNLKFDSGFGSVGTAYGCRAWINFNGSGTIAIRDSGNVSSITDNGTGNYTVTFTNAMTDVNYCMVGRSDRGNLLGGSALYQSTPTDATYNTTSVSFKTLNANDAAAFDYNNINIAIIR